MYLELSEGRIFYTVSGAGQPVILLHGNFNDHSIWDEQVEALSTAYQVIRLDWRGYGQSSTPTSPFSNVDDLKALIDWLKLDKVTLVGSSSGGGAAIDFTLAFPHLVRRLVFVCPSINGHPLPLRMTWHGIKNFYNVHRHGKERAIESFISNPFWQYYFPSIDKQEALAKVLHHIRNADSFCRFSPQLLIASKPSAIGRLDELQAPTLIVISDQDHPYNIKTAHLLHTKIKHSTKRVMENCRHLPFIENPIEFNKILIDFLSKIM